jgi:hypothetical protein
MGDFISVGASEPGVAALPDELDELGEGEALAVLDGAGLSVPDDGELASTSALSGPMPDTPPAATAVAPGAPPQAAPTRPAASPRTRTA